MMRARVISLNLWNRSGPWEERLDAIVRGLDALSADVVGLQEVVSIGGFSQADMLAERLATHGYRSAFGVAHDHGEGVGFGNAVLSRWPIRSSESVALPAGPGERRALLCAEIEAPFGPLPVFVTHLSWRMHEGVFREAQVVAIAEEVKRRAPIHGPPPLLLGDFNAEPESSEIRFLRGLQSLSGRSAYFADTFALAGDGRGVTFDPGGNAFAATTHEPPRRIDYVFVRGPDAHGRGKPLAARVVLDTAEAEIWPSDHYGVLADIAY